GTEPARSIVPDPYATWEIRTHFGQPATVPPEPPRTLEQLRIAHNIAVAEGDEARAAAMRAQIEGRLRPLHVAYDDGVEVVGTTFSAGARSLLTVFLRAPGPEPGLELVVRSEVIKRAALSTTMADPTKREVGLPLAIAPARWRTGFLYADP